MNDQRQVIFSQRLKILKNKNIEEIKRFLKEITKFMAVNDYLTNKDLFSFLRT